MCAARTARLFSLARPIKFLICGVVVAVPVIVAKAPLRFDDGNVNDNATNQWFNWLNEECSTLFDAMFWRCLQNDDVKFSYLTFSRQHELAAVNLSVFACTWKPFVPSRRKCTPPILYNATNMKWKRLNLTQSSILMWPFRCSCRRSFLNSLLLTKWSKRI